jgi:hypothetical protein
MSGSDTIIVGILFLLIVSATTFYLYSRLVYSERKISLMENLLLDVKMSMEMEREINHSHDTGASDKPVMLEPNFEKADDIEMYESVVEKAAIESEALPVDVSGEVPVHTGAEQVDAVNYDLMTRDELVALAEKNGLRVTKRQTKNQIIALVRGGNKNTSGGSETGTDGPVGGTSGSVEGASLNSDENES